MFIYMKNGNRREMALAFSAAESGEHVVLYDRQENEVGRVRRADIDAYSFWAIEGTSQTWKRRPAPV